MKLNVYIACTFCYPVNNLVNKLLLLLYMIHLKIAYMYIHLCTCNIIALIWPALKHNITKLIEGFDI